MRKQIKELARKEVKSLLETNHSFNYTFSEEVFNKSLEINEKHELWLDSEEMYALQSLVEENKIV